jgi:hypothetical protein
VLAAVALLLLLVAAAQSAGAQDAHATLDATSLREPADLSKNWRVYAGDDPAFASPGFDDSQWKFFDPGAPLTDIFGKSDPGVI